MAARHNLTIDRRIISRLWNPRTAVVILHIWLAVSLGAGAHTKFFQELFKELHQTEVISLQHCRHMIKIIILGIAMSMSVSATMHLNAVLSGQLIDDMNDPELCSYELCLTHGRGEEREYSFIVTFPRDSLTVELFWLKRRITGMSSSIVRRALWLAGLHAPVEDVAINGR